MTLPQFFGNDILYITDGTPERTLNLNALFNLDNWNRAIQDIKNGGVWQDSPLADNRQLIDYRWGTVIEEFDFSNCAVDADRLARNFILFREMLIQARDFWVHPTKIRPVYFVRKHRTEKVIRYALIHNWSTPADTDISNKKDSLVHRGITAKNYIVFIERSAWRKNPPGLSECVRMAHLAIDATEVLYSELFEETTAYAEVPDPINVEDVNFAVDGWFKVPASGLPAGGGYICNNTDSSAGYNEGWYILIDDAAGQIRITLGVFENTGGPGFVQGEEIARWTIEPHINLGEWFWMGISRNRTGGDMQLWINANLVTRDSYSDSGYANFYNSAHNLIIGATETLLPSIIQQCQIYIGWFRIFDYARWLNPVSTPVVEGLCPLPDNMDTLGLWKNQIGSNSILQDYSETGGLDATLTDVTIDFVCGDLTNSVEYCHDNIIKNGNGLGVQYVFQWDNSAAAFSLNLVGNLGLSIGPDPLATNDAFYIGCDVPFDIVTLNLLSAQSNTSVVYEVWSGAAWSNITGVVTDETALLQNLGPNQIYLNSPTQAATTVNGQNAYWLRFRYTGGGAATPAYLADDIVLIDSVNYIFVENAGGEIGVESQFNLEMIFDPSDLFPGTVFRMLTGIKNMDESPDFRATLNFSDVFSGALDITATASDGAFVNDADASTGRAIAWTGTTVGSNYMPGYLTIPASVANQYNGIFNIILRARVDNPAAANTEGGFTLRIRLRTMDSAIILAEDIVTLKPKGPVAYYMGRLELPIAQAGILPFSNSIPDLIIEVRADCLINNAVLTIYDLTLMPIDESYLDTWDDKGTLGLRVEQILETGCIQTLTRNVLPRVWESGFAEVIATWDYFSQRRFMINSKGRQAIFFLFYSNWSSEAIGAESYFSDPRLTFALSIDGNQLYLSAISEGE